MTNQAETSVMPEAGTADKDQADQQQDQQQGQGQQASAVLCLDAPHMVDTGACCAACYRTDVPLLRCSACLHAWYCSQECQRQHYKDHKPSCKVLKRFSQLHSDLPQDIRPKTAHEFYVQRLNARRLLEQIMRKPLGRPEARAIMNEAKCSVCMSTRDQVEPGVLSCCHLCHWGWVCEQHAQKYLRKAHTEVCPTYRLMNDCQMWVRDMLKATGKLPTYRPDILNTTYNPLPTEGWDAYKKWRPLPAFTPAMLAVFSKRLSQPLTVVAALQLLYSQQELESLQQVVVHVLGASAFEVPADGVWEEVMHLLPAGKFLEVHFIGPEVADIIIEEDDGRVLPKAVCHGCEQQERTRCYAYHMCTYHDFLKRQQEAGQDAEPTIAVAFNSGLYDDSDWTNWQPTVQALISHNTPVCFTSYNQEEGEADSQRWVQTGGQLVQPAACNPYRATEPIMEPSAVDTFYYQNYYWWLGRGQVKADLSCS